MFCPLCRSANAYVRGTRQMGNRTTQRSYYCEDCVARFTTEESVLKIKKDGKYAPVEIATEKEKRAYRQGIMDAMKAVDDLLEKKR